MMDPIYLLAPLILVLFSIYYVYQKWMVYKGPPHVTGLPILGYAPFLSKEPYLKFQQLMEKHGPIFSLYMGSHYTVVLGNYDVIHEAFVEKGNLFNARPTYLAFRVYDHETAFFVTEGEEWKVTKTFTMNALRKLGFGKNYTENFLQMEIRDLISELEGHKGNPVFVEDILSKSTALMILSLMTGNRYNRSGNSNWADRVILATKDLIKSYSHDVGDMIPWVRKLPFSDVLTCRKATRTAKDKLWSIIEEEVKPLKKTYSSSTEPNTFVHSWYMEQDKYNKSNDPYKHLFSDFSLTNHLDMLLQGSSDTTSTTLLWAFLYLVLHQDIQDKVHKEIDEHIGFREPTLDDAKNMHYTKAFLLEVQRKATIVPLSLFHSNKVQGTIKGFKIPKDTVVIANLWSVHHDSNRFPDPYKFDPERFMDEDKKFKPCEYMSAFSFGRRTCPGKQVAEMQLFLYLTSILQAFELHSPPNSSPSDKENDFDKAIIRRPVPYGLVFAVRKNNPN